MNECRCGFLLMAAVAGFAACAGETVLWPSALTEMKAQQDSKIALLPDGSMGVVTGVKASWPGMRMDFKAGEMDLSAYGRITIAVSNTTAKACTVNLSVKGVTHQGQSPGGSVVLTPFAAGEMKVNLRNMPWVLDAPAEIVGMRGYPSAKGGSTFDIRRTHSFHIFFNQKGEPGGFSVKRVAVSGEGVPPKVLKAATFFPFVDRFGQFRHDEWPGKVHDEAELKATAVAEEAWLAEHAEGPIPDCDRFGGWTAGPKLAATGFFRTEKVNGKWWLVDPDGYLFFSHGVDCVRTGAETGIGFREKYFEWVPKKDDPVFGKFLHQVRWPQAHGFYKDPAHLPYTAFSFGKANAVRKYGEGWRTNQAERAHRRIRAWGLNTIANWSDPEIYRMAKTPYTATFGTRGPVIEGSTGWWGKLRDPFAPEFVANAKKSAADEAKRTGTDPWCIGWFVDNELSWGKDNRDLARAVLRSPANQPAKRAFRDALAAKYGTAGKLDAAWGTRYGTWEGFLSATNAVDETRAGTDLEELHRSVVAQYFRTIRDAIKSVAPNRLYLGTRIAWGADVIYEESARYCDVVSVNIYSRRPVRDLPPGAVDKPMINGEFHFGALDRGMFHTGLVGTRDQTERAQCYRDFVNACLDHPRFVGTHWFQWQDQALTGRGDGENYQIGFVTVTDTPYPELVAAARDIGRTMYRRRRGVEADFLDVRRHYLGGADVVTAGYRTLVERKASAFSFRGVCGAREWVEFVPAVGVNREPLAPLALARTDFEGRSDEKGRCVVEYTNDVATMTVTLLPTRAEVGVTVHRRGNRQIREVDIGLGSRTDSDYAFDPSASGLPYHEHPIRKTISVSPGLTSPPPFLIANCKEGREGCWSVALEPTREQLTFRAFQQIAAPDGSLSWRVGWQNDAPTEKGDFVVPPFVFRFGDADVFAALRRHFDDLVASGKVRRLNRTFPAWHGEPIACTWCFQNGDNRKTEGHVYGAKQDEAREDVAEAYMKLLDDNGIHYGTLIVDDWWGVRHGIWEADSAKWKDMRAFVDRCHARGKKVVLWICTDGDGLPEDERWGSMWKLESPAFQKRLREAAHRLLSSDPGCYDADGVKFDFSSSYATKPDPARRFFGVGYLLRRFEMLTEALLAAKPDALLDYQCCNPYFYHTQTMLRLNDYFGTPACGFEEMSIRAKIARIVAPDCLIDTDHVSTSGSPYDGGYEFFRRVRELGVPSYYLWEDEIRKPELLKILRSIR